MINISRENLCWLAGLLEGEGCFHWSKAGSPLISLAMTDLDIVEKVRDILHPTGPISRVERDEKRKILYRFKTYGINSIEWMKLLYPLMGIRRREKITEILDLWNSKKPSGLARNLCPRQHDLTDPNSYYLQGNHKICKICNIKRANEKKERDNTKTDEQKEKDKRIKIERGAIKALAIQGNMSIEEAKEMISSTLNKYKGIIQ